MATTREPLKKSPEPATLVPGYAGLYAYDEAGQTIGEYNADGSLINEIVYLGDMPVLAIRQSGVWFIQADQLNTPRAILSSSGTVVWKWDSDAFGSTPANEDPDGNGLTLQFNLRFPGQLFDAETGLHYNCFRDYDPVTGRYVESDPIGLSDGVNTYGYAHQNPAMLYDPNGQAAVGAIGVCFIWPIGTVSCAATGVAAGYLIIKGSKEISASTSSSSNTKTEECEDEEDCGPYTRVQAYIQAQFLAGIPRASRSGMQNGNPVPGRTPIPFTSINDSSRGPNSAEILRNGGSNAGYYNTFDPLNRIEDHPDGHPHQMGSEFPGHHDCPHLHVYGPGGRDLGVIPYNRES